MMSVRGAPMRTELGSAALRPIGNYAARALLHVQEAVTQSGLVDTLAPFGIYGMATRPAADALLRCYAMAFAARDRFSEAEHVVVRALDVETAFSNSWWASLITAVARDSVPQAIAQEVSELCARLRLLTHNLGRLTALLDEETDRSASAGASLLMRLQTRDGAPPKLRQVAAAIEAVDLLATAVAELHGSADTLRLEAADADGALAFGGSELLIGSMTALVAAIGEHVDANMDPNGGADPWERAAAIAPLLPITGQIGGRQDAARLRSLVETGVEQLLVAGWGTTTPPGRTLNRSANVVPTDPTALPADLASLIAEERRHLSVKPGEPRRMWRQADRSAGLESALPHSTVNHRTD